MNPAGKYKSFSWAKPKNRQWPDKVITQAPIWCSVDLRDGNQALQTPMTIDQKTEFFLALVKCGFKEIEVGFPAASETEFGFMRRLIGRNLIPNDVTVQVLVQAREDLIEKTFKSLIGAKRAIVHMYNSTSPVQRRIVFGNGKPETIAMAVAGTKLVKHYAEWLKRTEVMFQYSPESFSATETDFALEVCEAVMDVWCPTPQRKIILNLPDTVQMGTPNTHADQIEWFCTHMSRRDCAIISLHVHNDRGTGIAATELGLMAGADRVEGTLFGNGERTGNTDIVAVALNMYTQGIDMKLDFSNLPELVAVYERCTGMKVPERQPYSGELVFTAFSGSHQDAIRKGLRARQHMAMDTGTPQIWDMPYLTTDPTDIGRTYQEVIRVNGQSGKGGIAHLLEQNYKIRMPKDMEREFGAIAGKRVDALGREVTAEDLKIMFWEEYMFRGKQYELGAFRKIEDPGICRCFVLLMVDRSPAELTGKGNGPIAAFIDSLKTMGVQVHVLDQSEHALGTGEDAQAIGYIKLQFPDGQVRWGAGIDTNTELANIKAVISALNRK